MTDIILWLEWLFGGDIPQEPLRLHQIGLRAVAVYVLGLLVVRIGKSRLISRASARRHLGIHAGIAAQPRHHRPCIDLSTFVASAVLVMLHSLFTAIGFYWHGFGSMVKGHAREVIEDGHPIEANLRRSHISEQDLLGELRLQGVENCEDVKTGVQGTKRRSQRDQKEQSASHRRRRRERSANRPVSN